MRSRQIEARTVRGLAREIGVPAERLARAGGGGVEVVVPKGGVTLRVRDEIDRLGRVRQRGGSAGLAPPLVAAARWLERAWEACMWDDGGAIDPARIRVDGGGGTALPERALEARDKVRRVMAVMGPQTRAVVTAIVIDGERLGDVGRRLGLARNERDRRAAAGWLLRAGLEAIAEHLRIPVA